jgi:hypothetical protein
VQRRSSEHYADIGIIRIMPTDELCRVDQTSRVTVKRIDPAIRHNQKASRKGPWVLRVATRAASRRAQQCSRLLLLIQTVRAADWLYLANIASRWRRLDYRETVRFSIESIIELLTFRYAIDIVEKTTFADFTNLRNPYGLSRCAWNRSLLGRVS